MIAPFSPEKTLEIQNGQDSLEAGNLLSIIGSNLPPKMFIGQGGDWGIGPLRFDLQAPGHTTDTHWKPQAMEDVRSFLQTYFPKKS